MLLQIGLPDLLSAALCPFLYIGGLQGGVRNNWGFRHGVTWLDGQLVLERTRAGWAENSKRGAQAWSPECMGSSASVLDESPGLWSSALAVTRGHSQRPRSVPWSGVQNRPPPAVSLELLLRTVHFSAPRTPAVFTRTGHLNQSHLPFPHAHVDPSHLGHSARTIFISASSLSGGASATKHTAGPPPWTRWCGTGLQCRAMQEPGLI